MSDSCYVRIWTLVSGLKGKEGFGCSVLRVWMADDTTNRSRHVGKSIGLWGNRVQGCTLEDVSPFRRCMPPEARLYLECLLSFLCKREF